MKNREKYAKEILDIACKGGTIAIDKNGNLVDCRDLICDKCAFGKALSCKKDELIPKWCESEYVEKPILTTKEKLFLDLIREEYTYMARDEDNQLSVYHRKPEKKSTYWLLPDNPNNARILYIRALNVSFDFIKWEDEEPWLIDDLKKLEVEDK